MEIYQIKNLVNNKIYIGSSVCFNKRKKTHILHLRKGKHHSIKLQRSWNKYGENSFIFEIIEVIYDISKILEREQFYLDLYKSYEKGYNICEIAGSTLGMKHRQETKEKMSKSHSGVKRMPCSLETKEKISKSKLNSDSSISTSKRKITLLSKDANIFKLIGLKSSITQIKNGLHKGDKNPNSNTDNILIFNNLNEVIYISNNKEFKKICVSNSLPHRALLKSKLTNGEYKLYLSQPPRNDYYKKYTGWYCKYEKTNL